MTFKEFYLTLMSVSRVISTFTAKTIFDELVRKCFAYNWFILHNICWIK